MQDVQMIPCSAPAFFQKDRPAIRTLSELVSVLKGTDRCPRPASHATPFGVNVCAECGERMQRAHESGETLLSILQKEKHGKILPYTLTPLEPPS